MVKIIGIDDAGRGPVIGPMVLAGVLIDEFDNSKLKEMGVKDSKLLSIRNRKRVRDKIVEDYKHHLEISEPREIDESSNLNYLEAVKAAMIINKLVSGLDEKVKVVLDCPSTNLSAWKEDVWGLVKKQDIVSLVCEHKADLNHSSVSAASIIAKEKREEELRKLRRELGVDFGSGYPADPKTKDFIRDNFDNPKYKKIIRFSWKTVKRLVEEGGQKKLF